MPIHPLLVLVYQLVESQITAGGVLKLGEDFVVFQTRSGVERVAWTTKRG
jgi:hypothetical protein